MTTECNQSKLVQPVFILSMPRAGSTLFQRLLAGHPQVATSAEPWILLPLLYAKRDCGLLADYGHQIAAKANRDFVTNYVGLENARSLMRDYVIGLYAAASKGRPLFVDKTPRYSLVLPEIIEIFPEAKFIFLWRDPLSVISSMVKTFNSNRWKIYGWDIDLFEGLSNLVACSQQLGESALNIRFEDLVANPQAKLHRVCEYLSIDYDQQMLADLDQVQLTGSMGDPTGRFIYNQVTAARASASIVDTINTRTRRNWSRRYIDWVGDTRLSYMGYEAEDLYRRLNETCVSNIPHPVELLYILRSNLQRRFRAHAVLQWRPRRRPKCSKSFTA